MIDHLTGNIEKVVDKNKDCKTCDLLEAIAFEGISTDTDKLIKAIHNIQKTGLKVEGCEFVVKKDLALAMAQSADGMKLTRAAFAIMIKFSDLQDDFEIM